MPYDKDITIRNVSELFRELFDLQKSDTFLLDLDIDKSTVIHFTVIPCLVSKNVFMVFMLLEFLLANTKLQFSFANSKAIAFPIPLVAPVIKAYFEENIDCFFIIKQKKTKD